MFNYSHIEKNNAIDLFMSSSSPSNEDKPALNANPNIQRALYLSQYNQLRTCLLESLEKYTKSRRIPSKSRRDYITNLNKIIEEKDILTDPKQQFDNLVITIQAAANGAQTEQDKHYKPGMFSARDSLFSKLLKESLVYVPKAAQQAEKQPVLTVVSQNR